MNTSNHCLPVECDSNRDHPHGVFRRKSVVGIAGCFLGFSLGLSSAALSQTHGVLHVWGDSVYDLKSKTVGSPSHTPGVVDFHADARKRMILVPTGSTRIWGVGRNTYPSAIRSLQQVAALDGSLEATYAILDSGEVVPMFGAAFAHGQLPNDLGHVVQVASGQRHSLALRENGTVVGWGIDESTAAKVPNDLEGVVQIAAGQFHSVALKRDGTVVAWGESSEGRIDVPLDLQNVASVAAGKRHTVALLEDGSLRAWGNPQDVDGIPIHPNNFTSIAVGATHTVALDEDGTVHVWGASPQLTPTIPPDARVSAIFAGDNYTAVIADRAFPILEEPLQEITVHPGHTATFTAILDENTATTIQWFKNGVPIPDATEPTYEIVDTVPGDAGVYTATISGHEDLTTSSSTILSVRPRSRSPQVSGSVVTWRGISLSPELEGQLYRDMAAGQSHVLLLREDGAVTAVGRDTFGQSSVPSELTQASKVAAGQFHSLAITPQGTVIAWGANRAGQSTVPADLSGVVGISAGNYHSVALKDNGTVVCWGDNRLGQTDVPTGLNDVIAIASGEFHNLALKSDGTVVAWGRNSKGQTNVPTALANVVAISAASHHSVALLATGKIVSWGPNALFLRDQTDRLNGITQIAAGNSRLAVTSADGETNLFEVGRTQPLHWVNLKEPISLTLAYNHVFAIRSPTLPEGERYYVRIRRSEPIGQRGWHLVVEDDLGRAISPFEAAQLSVEAKGDLKSATPWVPIATEFDIVTGHFAIAPGLEKSFFRVRALDRRR